MGPAGNAHAGHDLELVARAAVGDLDARAAIVARDRLSTCEACAALAAELRAIVAATRELGAAGLAAPSHAPRDFRLTEADAARLRRVGVIGRAVPSAWFAGRARGLGPALATLGLVGLLVSVGLPGLSGGAASQSTRQEIGASGQYDHASPVPALGPAATDTQALQSSNDPTRTRDKSREQVTLGVPPSVVVAVISAAMLVIGLALLVAAHRRRRAGP